MATTQYDIGDQVRITAVTKDVAGDDTDPTTLKFYMKSPSGVVVPYEWTVDDDLVKDSTGNFHVDYILSEAGDWYYRWEAEGAVHSAEEVTLRVRQSMVV